MSKAKPAIKEKDEFRKKVERNLEKMYLETQNRYATANYTAASAIVAFHFMNATNMTVSIRPCVDNVALGSVVITGRNMDQIEAHVKQLLATGKKSNLTKADSILKNEIYFAGARSMADHIDLIKYGMNQEYMETWKESDNCVASPEFDLFGEEDFYLALDLFDLIHKGEDENDYFRAELAVLKKFLEVNWSSVEKVGELLTQNIFLEEEELLPALKKLKIKQPKLPIKKITKNILL